MPLRKIVVKFRNGRILKGQTDDFFPGRHRFQLATTNGQVESIRTGELKAIFFVRDHAGDKDRFDRYEEEVPGVGRKMRVTMKDGETFIGYAAGYTKNRPGFFLVPADSRCNNERMFIINDFCKEASFV